MASIKILLRNKPNKQGQYPVVLKIIKDRKIKVITLGISCLEKDWDKANAKFKKSQNNYMQRNRALLKKKEEALKRKSSKVTVSEFWKEKISDFIKAGRIGNSKPYKDTYNSFFKFHNNKNLVFREITPAFLDKYETFLRSNNNSDGGIGIKMRTIRALYNYAIKSGVVDEKYYPFKVYKISKFKAKGIKKALIRDEMKLMEAIDTQKYPHLINTKNYLVFSYYMGGMNFIDMMKLKWENIQGDRVQYIRSKTKGKFTVKMLEPVKQIITYSLRRFNKQLKEIAKIQGVEQNVTSYVIRHSFATNLKFAGISTDVIGKSMGHADVSITQAYLKEFKDDIIDDAMSKLLEEPTLKYAS